MEIIPTYVTFEQAKLLKEKGFDEKCLNFYCINTTCNYIEIPCEYSFAVNANKDSEDNFGYGKTWSAPEQWQVVEWLRINHHIYLWSRYVHTQPYGKYDYIIVGIQNYKFTSVLEPINSVINSKVLFDTPQEAYSAAFDHILKHLI